MKPIKTIRKSCSVGIYNSEYVARIYKDKIIVTTPCVKWVGNTGGYHEYKTSIRDTDVIAKITSELSDECDRAAWNLIGAELRDDHLIYGV